MGIVAEENPCQKRIFIGFLVLIAWIPLPMGSNRPWAWAILEMWTYFLTAAWLWGFYKEKLALPPAFLKSRIALTCLSLWLLYAAAQCLPLPVSLVSTLAPEVARMHQFVGQADWIHLSVDAHAAAQAWLKSLAYVLVFCLSLLLVDNRAKLKTLAYVIVFSGLFQAFYGAFMTLSGVEYVFFFKKYSHIGSASGTYVNRDHLAGYLEMCLAVGIGLMIATLGEKPALTRRQKIRNLIALLMGEKLRLRLYLAVMVIGLVLTHSRMGNAAFFSSMIAAGILGLILSRHATRSTVILLASLVVIDIFIVGAWFGVEKVVTRLENTSITEASERMDVSANALKQWKDYFLLGSGGGSFYTVFPRNRTGDLFHFYNHAHNDYLEFGSEYGIVGITILGTLVISSFIAAGLAQFRRRSNMMRGMAFSSIMGMVALLIHSFVDFNLQIPANAATFMVILSLGWLSFYLERD